MYGITLTPQLLKIAAVVALVIGLIVSFQFAQHSAEQRGYTKAQNEYTQKALIASQEARKRELALQTKLQEAQNESQQYQIAIATAADRARVELDGLRNELSTISDRLSRASAESLRKYAAAANSVFQQCVNRYSELAKKADQHAADALMLQRAWPKP